MNFAWSALPCQTPSKSLLPEDAYLTALFRILTNCTLVSSNCVTDDAILMLFVINNGVVLKIVFKLHRYDMFHEFVCSPHH